MDEMEQDYRYKQHVGKGLKEGNGGCGKEVAKSSLWPTWSSREERSRGLGPLTWCWTKSCRQGAGSSIRILFQKENVCMFVIKEVSWGDHRLGEPVPFT